MNSWPFVRLDACTDIVSGATPSTSEPSFWNGEICWATPKDLSELDGAYIANTPRKMTSVGLASCSAEVLPSGSVLFSSRAPIGHVAINTVPMATNQGFKSFVPHRDKLDAKFLYYWLRTNRSYLESLGNGATFKELSKVVVSRVELPLPPLAEQRRIAEILDKADALRAKRRAALARIDTLSQSIFLDTFGDPERQRWPRVALGGLCEKVIDCAHATPVYTDQDTALFCIRSSDIQNGELSFDDMKRLDASEFRKRITRGTPEIGDVIYCREGARFGNAARLTRPTSVCLGQRMMLLRPKRDAAVAEYLWAFLRSADAYRQATMNVGGSASPHVNIRDIVTFQVAKPPLHLQLDFARAVHQMDRLRISGQRALSVLDGLFKSLQHRAFRGEL